MASLLSWGTLRKAYDQVNPFDNNLTWKQRTPTQAKSTFQQLGQAGGQLTRAGAGGTARVLNTAAAQVPQAYYTGTGLVAQATGNNQALANSIRMQQIANEQFRRNSGGLLNVGTLYDADEARRGDLNTGIKRIGGGILESGLEIGSLGVGGLAGKQLVNQGIRQGIKTQLPRIGANALLNTAQGGVYAANQGASRDQIIKSALLSGTVGTAADIGLGVGYAGAVKLAKNAQPLNQVGAVGRDVNKGVGENIYHGTSPEIARQIEKSGFDIKKSADGSIWFTSNPKIGEVAATGKGGIVQRVVDTNKLKLGGWAEADKYGTQELLNQGYDGLKLVDKGETTYQIFNPEKLSKPAQPIGVGKNLDAPDNDVTQRMMLDYFKNKPPVKGSSLSGEGAQAPKTLSPEARAKLMAKMGPELPVVGPKGVPVKPTMPKPPGKPEFLDSTNRFLGAKTAAQTTNIAAVRQLPKLQGSQSLRAIDAIQNGATNGDFGDISGPVRQLLDSKHAQLKAAGVNVGYLEDYFPQQWKNATPEQVNNAYQILNQKAGFQNPRTIPTVQEGMSLGFTPKTTDYRQALNEYLNSADRLIANKQYFDNLKTQGLVIESASKPRGMQIIDAPGLPQARSLTDPELGIEVQQSHYATPEVARELNKLFSPDIRGTGGKIAKATGGTSGAMQTIFLSGGVPGTPLNAFGAAQWTKQALSGRPISATKAFFRGFSEKVSQNYEAKNLPFIQKMEKAGVPYRGTLDTKALTTVGERIAEKHGVGKAKAAILEGWDKAVEDPTFRRMMPQMQLDTFKGTYARLIKSGLPEEQAVSKAADATRNAFGLNTLAKDALKGKVGKDVTRTLFFAPKFRESMINFWGKNIKALGKPTDPAYRENIKFLANASILFGAMQAANMALNEGKTTFQNENPNDRFNLSIPRGGGKAITIPFLSSIATVPRVAGNAAVDIATGQFKEAGLEGKKLLSQLVRPPIDLLTNQKYNGREVYNPDDSAGQRLKDAALYTVGQYNHPYVSAGINAASGKSSGALETATTATELPIRFRNYDTTTPQAKDIKAGKELKDIKKKAGEGYSLQQLSNGKYAYNLNGDVKTTKNLRDAQFAIVKDSLENSDKNELTVFGRTYYKAEDGTVHYKTVKPPKVAKAKTGSTRRVASKSSGRSSGGRAGSRGGGSKTRASVSFKTASAIKAPSLPKISVKSPGTFKAPATRKYSVRKIASSATKRKLG